MEGWQCYRWYCSFSEFNGGNHDNKLGAAFLQLSIQKYFIERLFDVIVTECVAAYCSKKSCQTCALQAADAFTVETWMTHGLQLPQGSGVCRALESDSVPLDLQPQASDALPLGRVRSKGRPAAIGDLRKKKQPRVSPSDSEQDSAEFSQFLQPVGIVKKFWDPFGAMGVFVSTFSKYCLNTAARKSWLQRTCWMGAPSRSRTISSIQIYFLLGAWHAQAPRPMA